MDTNSQSLSQWAEGASSFSFPDWERLPEIYLYMDQVLSYMDKQLELFERNPEDPLLTSSMVNNYVKAGVLPRPEQKKYSREHLTLLTLICLLKSVLSIPDIAFLTQSRLKECSEKDLYQNFLFRANVEPFRMFASVFWNSKGKGNCPDSARHGAFYRSFRRRTAAERILTEITLQKKQTDNKQEENGKEHHKDKKEKD